MKNFRIVVVLVASFFSNHLFAESAAKEKFEEVFITAGYSAAFGAAIGAALLAFKKNPQDNLRYIAIGASVGFIAGTIAGVVFAVNPEILGEESFPGENQLAMIPDYRRSQTTLTWTPRIESQSGNIRDLSLSLNIPF